MRLTLFLLFFVLCSVANSATWYASATGSSTNGSYANPWSVPYSVTNTNPHLSPGDTVIFKDGGSYVCTETNATWSMAKELEFRKSGTPASKITYMSESLWGFTFDGGLLVPSTVSNLIFKELRITFTGSTNRETSTNSIPTIPAGMNVYGQGVDILHNLIENTGHPGIGSWAPTRGKYIAGNIVRFTGMNDNSPAYNGGARGSGMYMQNQDNSAEALIQGNITYHNYTTGMKAYGNQDIWGFTFRNQISVDNNEAGLFFHQDNYGSTNLIMDSNYLFQNGGVGLRVGYPLGNGGHSNAMIINNYVVEDDGYPFYQVDGWTGNTITNNIGVRLTQRYVWLLEVFGETEGDIASHTIDYNKYYSENSGGIGANPFQIKETPVDFTSWKSQVNGDNNSTWEYGVPTGMVVRAFSPSTDTRFVHVAVFNWNSSTNTTVNLNSYYSSGDSLKIYDVQELPTSYTNFTYSGGSVTLDLTRTNIAPILGDLNQRGPWTGFDSRFRAFVILKTASGGGGGGGGSGKITRANRLRVGRIIKL